MTALPVANSDPLVLPTTRTAKGGPARVADKGSGRTGGAGQDEAAGAGQDQQTQATPEGKGAKAATTKGGGKATKAARNKATVGAEQAAAMMPLTEVETPFAKMMRELGDAVQGAEGKGAVVAGMVQAQSRPVGPKPVVPGVKAGQAAVKVGPVAGGAAPVANTSDAAADATVHVGETPPVGPLARQAATGEIEATITGEATGVKGPSEAPAATGAVPVAGATQQQQQSPEAPAPVPAGQGTEALPSTGATITPGESSDVTTTTNDGATLQAAQAAQGVRDVQSGQASGRAPVQESARVSVRQGDGAGPVVAQEPASGPSEAVTEAERAAGSRVRSGAAPDQAAVIGASAKETVEITVTDVAPDRSQTAGETAAPEPGAVTQVESASPVDRAAPSAAASSPSRPGVADQIAEQVRQGSPQVGQRVVVRLDPPELGRVRLTLRGGRGGIRGVIEVDNIRALTQIQNATPPMLERLAEGGIPLRRLEVVLTGSDPGAGGASDSSLRDGAFAQQQGRSGQGSGGQGTWSGQGDADETPPPPRATIPTTVSDDSINVWI